MGTARDFHVKTGMVLDAGNLTLTNGNLLLNSGYIDIDNIKINGQTISTVAGNDDINITPHGTGEVNISKVDIDGGTIDITVGSGKTLDISAGMLTLANDQISGDKVSGGTIGTTTITALAGDLSLGENSITNVGDINADSISIDDAATGLNIDFSGANTGTALITLKDATGDALSITDGSNDWMVFNTSAETLTFGRNTTFASTTIADLGTVTTANIDGGTIDATVIGGATPAAITGTTIDASTDFTVGSTVITDDSIVMTPSTSDTVTIAAATNGALNITTVDNAAAAAHITVNADGNTNLQYGGSTKLQVVTGGVNITGDLDVTGSLDDITNVTATGFIHSAHARMRESTGLQDTADINSGSTGTHKILDIDGTNFYTSDTISVTEVSSRVKLPGTTYGTNAANVGNVALLAINTENSSRNVFQAAEAFCVMSIKNASGVIQKRVVNKIYGVVNPSGGIETIIEHESGDTALGKFHFTFHGDSLSSGSNDAMTLIFQYTSKYTHTSNDTTTYSFNMNGLSLSGTGA